jgi:hypothetical protein
MKIVKEHINEGYLPKKIKGSEIPGLIDALEVKASKLLGVRNHRRQVKYKVLDYFKVNLGVREEYFILVEKYEDGVSVGFLVFKYYLTTKHLSIDYGLSGYSEATIYFDDLKRQQGIREGFLPEKIKGLEVPGLIDELRARALEVSGNLQIENKIKYKVLEYFKVNSAVYIILVARYNGRNIDGYIIFKYLINSQILIHNKLEETYEEIKNAYDNLKREKSIKEGVLPLTHKQSLSLKTHGLTLEDFQKATEFVEPRIRIIDLKAELVEENDHERYIITKELYSYSDMIDRECYTLYIYKKAEKLLVCYSAYETLKNAISNMEELNNTNK